VTGGTIAGVTGLGSGAGAGAGGGAARRAISSGRTMTATKAAASPTIAEADMKARIFRIGRVDMDRIFLVGRRS
jgi:hypothetical protein